MSFEWYKLYKWEENIESEVTDRVFDYVYEYYGIENIEELTEEQIAEIREFTENTLNEYSPIQWGFSNLFNQWDEAQYEDR
ncbi:MAG: hypothetical protein VW270_30880 [Candidatus Poseidoniales archaeon]|jgi:hypothetical protein